MKFDQLVVLLPCQGGLESFDLQRKDEDAHQLLGAWSALWHPLLLASAKAIPRWVSAGDPPPDPAGYLVISPDCCEPSLPDGWLSQAEAAGACVLRNLPHRNDMLAAALERLGPGQPSVDPDLTADFLALGFCHFQVELLTHKLHYMSNLDATALQLAALAATDAALKGDVAAAHGHLQSAFDRLHEACEYTYPTEARLLDLTLVAPTTLGAPLQMELSAGLPRNLLVSGKVIEEMAQREPATLDALKRACAENKAALIGGEYAELPLPLLDPEAIEMDLRRGLNAYQTHLEQRPKVFGRRRFGLTPALPQILERAGFIGALHCTLDDGRFPTGNQSRIQWEGPDGTTIEAIGCLPVDAGRAATFLQLADTISNGRTFDDTATLMFAHWPGRSSPWYDDLRRIAAFGSIFGSFMTVTDYFEQTAYSAQRNHYKSDEYRSPYLRQDVSAGRRDPISRWTRYFRRWAARDALDTMNVLAGLCGSTMQTDEDEFAAAIEDSLDTEESTASSLENQLADRLGTTLAGFANTITGGSASTERGCLVVNPLSFSQQACLHSSPGIPHPSTIDVPAMGFAWVGSSDEPAAPPAARSGWFGKRRQQESPPLADENVLRNEFFEVHFDPHTGAIRTIADYHSRDPRLAQQIALRLPRGDDPGAEMNYTIMAADEIAVTSRGPVLGEIVSRGRLVDRDGRRVAGFRQTTRAWRGCRVIDIHIELDIERQLEPNPWDSYCAARFAWKDDAAVLHRSANMANLPTELTQFESPYFVDIRRAKQHTTLLLAGLPYHRRFGTRKLDTLLVTQGETARSFRLGIGIDVPHPMSAALGFLSPPLILPDQPKPKTPTGWLFHLDCRNVLATHWELLPTDPGEESRLRGFRVRLLETDGQGVRLSLRCFRNVASAHKMNLSDVPPVELTVEGDRINIPIGPHQMVEVEVQFAS